MQWVSTFACGAPSLGRPRCLTVHPAESGPPSPLGIFGENSPHIYKEHPEGKNGEKIFAVTELPEGEYMSMALRPESEDNLRIADNSGASMC